MTVGASTVTDGRAWLSNWGSCVDTFAPGHNICAAWHTSDTDIKCISGTSMASPHVAGVMALLAADREPMTTEEMKNLILTMGGKGKISDVRGSPNILLNNGQDVNKTSKSSHQLQMQSLFKAILSRRYDL